MPCAFSPNGRWELAVVSGSAPFLSAVTALQPRVRLQCRTAERLLVRLAERPCQGLLLIATDDLTDLPLLELLPALVAQLRPSPLRVVLFLEDLLDQERLAALVAAGAGVICRLQRFHGSSLAEAINQALRHQPWLDPFFAEPRQPVPLPGREWELLRQVGQGYNASEISHHLGIRCDTVRRALSQLYRRIGVRDRAQAVGWCLCHGLISRQELQRRYRPPGGPGSGGQGTPGASGASGAPDDAMR
ncbi:MAG: LuxR C-terminal-related transcriptional regulator [Cyanobacteriota bacterium]